ncbi:hypothetical protein F4808DRAFT_146593 [Astrocystis sublimbata]|nr:hypothetical protein F4808DRAFT_146593 [Astrocystis sublimbata]
MMNCSPLRFARHVGVRSWAKPLSTGHLRPSTQQITRATYSSLSRASCEGKTAIVTGASQGIGKAIALRLAADGYNVCVNDLKPNLAKCEEVVEEIRSMGKQSCFAIADVAKREEVRNMVQTSVRELGPLKTMVANAGIVQVADLLDISEESFRRMLDVNVLGVHNCMAEAAKTLISQGDCRPDNPGKLIASSSIVGFKAFFMLPHYSTSKWAVRGLMQAYAARVAKHNITANVYAPGIVGTNMWDTISDGIHEHLGVNKEEVTEAYTHSNSLLGRVSVPEDVAKLVSFLASSDSDYITGQTQLVDGGIILT